MTLLPKTLITIAILILIPSISLSAAPSANTAPNTSPTSKLPVKAILDAATIAQGIAQAEQDHPTEMANLEVAADATRGVTDQLKDIINHAKQAGAAAQAQGAQPKAPDFSGIVDQLRIAQRALIEATQATIKAGIDSEIVKALIKQRLGEK